MVRTMMVLVVALLGCGGDAATGGDAAAEVQPDAGDVVAGEVGVHDTSVADSAPDSAPDTREETSVADSASEVAPDALVDTRLEDTSVPDSAVDSAIDARIEDAQGDLADATSETVIEGPRGQCGDSFDCPGTLFCADSAPGGICNGCSGSDPCPDGHWCNEFGGCSRDCETRADCPHGMRCHPTQTICALESCSDSGDCEAPYVCDGGFCRRPACATGDVCPNPLTCVAGTCIEPYWLD